MVQVDKDYHENLTPETLDALLDELVLDKPSSA